MALPANDDTRNAQNVYIEKIENQIYRVLNNTGATINQGDYVLLHGFFGVALQEAANNIYFDLRVDDEMEVQANDLVTGKDTFGTIYQTVYFNNTSKEFSDTSGFGYPVGKLSRVKDSDGSIRFFNLVKNIPLDDEIAIDLNVDEDASAGLQFDLGFNGTVKAVRAISTLSNTSATAILENSAGTAITNAIDIDTLDAFFWATSIIAATRVITDGILQVDTAAAADRCLITVIIKPNI